MLSLYVDRHPVTINRWNFPAGETGIKLTDMALGYNSQHPQAHITLKWQGNEDLIELALLNDAVRRNYPKIPVNLTIDYFPYARQDRVCNAGESHSLKVICNFINSMNFDRVFVTDPHSDVLGALLYNIHICSVEQKVLKAMQDCKATVIVSPDAGALKKIQKYAQFVSTYIPEVEVMRADKTRDVKTGKITGTVVYNDIGQFEDKNVLVVDDILDGGGTFIPLADELQMHYHGTINIMVTHGIFTKGVDIVADVYDNIYVVNNMFGSHNKIKEI
jgi:ribose-phosphate pyrophosphokinase